MPHTQALASLKTAPHLTSLTVDLDGNHLQDAGAHALAGLRHSTSLTELSLNFEQNGVGPSGLRVIALLLDVPALRALSLTPRPRRRGKSRVDAAKDLLNNMFCSCGSETVGPAPMFHDPMFER